MKPPNIPTTKQQSTTIPIDSQTLCSLHTNGWNQETTNTWLYNARLKLLQARSRQVSCEFPMKCFMTVSTCQQRGIWCEYSLQTFAHHIARKQRSKHKYMYKVSKYVWHFLTSFTKLIQEWCTKKAEIDAGIPLVTFSQAAKEHFVSARLWCSPSPAVRRGKKILQIGTQPNS